MSTNRKKLGQPPLEWQWVVVATTHHCSGGSLNSSSGGELKLYLGCTGSTGAETCLRKGWENSRFMLIILLNVNYLTSCGENHQLIKILLGFNGVYRRFHGVFVWRGLRQGMQTVVQRNVLKVVPGGARRGVKSNVQKVAWRGVQKGAQRVVQRAIQRVMQRDAQNANQCRSTAHKPACKTISLLDILCNERLSTK